MDAKGWAMLLLTLIYLYGMFLKWIEKRSEQNPVPPNVIDVYDRDTYRVWRQYHGEKCRLGLIEKTAEFVIDFLLIALNLYAGFAALFPDTPFWRMAGVLALSALTSLLLLPFSYWDTMKIEEKYGFNRSTKKTFWADQAKGFVIQLLILLAVGSLLLWVHQTLGDWMILAFALAMTAVGLFIAFLYPHLSKIFNKFTPLEEGELKEKLTALLEKNGYHPREIQVMDASRRSTKSNAYFSGFGKMKTIVLYDTLVQSLTTDEICAVFAHELGHGLHKDTLRNQLLSFAQMMALGVLAWLTLRSDALFAPFGFDKVNYGFAMILIMSVEFALVQPLFGLLISHLSRRAEYRADAQAVKEGYGEALISGLKKLARQNFSALAPSPLLVKLEYSHPTLSQRITAIEKSLGRKA